MPVDADRARGGVVEAREQLDDRRLAGAGVADERDGLAGGDAEVDAVQHLGALAVAEMHVVESSTAPSIGGTTRRPASSCSSGCVSITSKILSSAALAARNVL